MTPKPDRRSSYCIVKYVSLYRSKFYWQTENAQQPKTSERLSRSPSPLNIVCGACGAKGHMKTNGQCPLFPLGAPVRSALTLKRWSDRPLLTTADQSDAGAESTPAKKSRVDRSRTERLANRQSDGGKICDQLESIKKRRRTNRNVAPPVSLVPDQSDRGDLFFDRSDDITTRKNGSVEKSSEYYANLNSLSFCLTYFFKSEIEPTSSEITKGNFFDIFAAKLRSENDDDDSSLLMDQSECSTNERDWSNANSAKGRNVVSSEPSRINGFLSDVLRSFLADYKEQNGPLKTVAFLLGLMMKKCTTGDFESLKDFWTDYDRVKKRYKSKHRIAYARLKTDLETVIQKVRLTKVFSII